MCHEDESVMEQLEQRQLLSSVGINANEALVIRGSERPDTIAVTVFANQSVSVALDSMQFTGLSDVRKIKIFGKAGNDSISVQEADGATAIPAVIFGAGGSDSVSVGDGNNLIFGGNGDDSIVAGNGNNLLIGGEGNNTILHGTGQDTVLGADNTAVSNNETTALNSAAPAQATAETPPPALLNGGPSVAGNNALAPAGEDFIDPQFQNNLSLTGGIGNTDLSLLNELGPM